MTDPNELPFDSEGTPSLMKAANRPEVIARANAEWEAMDWRGRLPEGWKYEAKS